MVSSETLTLLSCWRKEGTWLDVSQLSDWANSPHSSEHRNTFIDLDGRGKTAYADLYIGSENANEL